MRLSTILLAAAACSGPSGPSGPTVVTDNGATYFPASTWRTANPRDVGMDENRIDAIESRIRSGALGDIDGLVIVRNGYVVLEQYGNGSSATHVHEMQSVTKSVTSLLVGIASDQGKVRVTDKALERFHGYEFQGVDQRKRDISVGHLLKMTSGLDFYEAPYPGSPLQRLNDSNGDWLQIIFDQPMNATPGELWQYNSGGVISLGAVIHDASGVAADQFAREHLFNPLGIGTTYWLKGNPNGLPHMGGGLGMRTSDLARIGYLVLRKGRWGERQVVSEAWLRESTAHHVRNPRTFGSHPTDYGYLWWLLPLDDRAGGDWDTDIITASGAKGQWLFIIPKHDIVVAATSSAAGFTGYLDPAEILYDYVIPSITSR